ncbi:hypothetical protein GW17_00050887 [Ensete ventricosum]|nr:hypothetical protein GW17_00050887 [Ensete ventricosum]
MARPPIGATTHSQAACRGSRLRPGPPTRATARGQPARGSRQQAQSPTAKAVASRHGRPLAWLALTGVGSACRGDAHGGAPFGTAPAHKGGVCEHNTRRSYRPRGNDAYRKGGCQ